MPEAVILEVHGKAIGYDEHKLYGIIEGKSGR